MIERVTSRPSSRSGGFYSALIVFSSLLLLSACSTHRSHLKVGKSVQGEVVEAEGLAPYDSADLIQTKRISLVDAQKNAVEKAVGVFVSGKTFVEKAVAIENNILAKTDGYVKKFDILSQSVEGGFYKTKIRALVALKDIEDDLRSSSLLNLQDFQKPRLVLLMSENIQEGVINEDKAASRALQKILMSQGFEVLDSTTSGAEILLKGVATAYPFQGHGLGGFVSYRARLTVEALRQDTQVSFISIAKEASGLGGNNELAGLKALDSVGLVVGSDLGPQIIEAWGKSRKAIIWAEETKDFSQVERMRKHLISQPGVQDLQLRSFYEGKAVFDLLLGRITPNELATHLQNGSSLPLNIIEIKGQLIRVNPK
ncbi:MAG: hypothetical protein ACKVQC_08765 [Elusimicrobiota bacterium]